MKKLFLLLACSVAASGFAQEEFVNKLFAERPQAVSKMVASDAPNSNHSDTIFTLPLPMGEDGTIASQESAEVIIPSLLQNGRSASNPSSSKKSSKHQYYETYAVYISYSGGYSYHIADYYDGTRVVTCLDGPVAGWQVIGVNGSIVAESSVVDYHSNYMVHYHNGGKIYTYSNRQVLEIY